MRIPCCTALAFLVLTIGSLAQAGPTEPSNVLDNGTLRVGVNPKAGGAITWLSKSGSDENLVNNYDLGRQIQMSYYSGPVPYVVGDKKPVKHWEHIGWNPIQAGDDFHHSSRITALENDGHTLHVQCVPMIWPLDNVPAECTFDAWITLEKNTAQVRCRMVNHRGDTTQYDARRQELPALYTNGPYHRLMSYTGDRPFTGAPLTRVEKRPGNPDPWAMWHTSEHWAALVRDDDFGVGLWHPGCCAWGGGFAGQPGAGGTHDSPTGYLSPGFDEIIDHDIEHEYRYVLILGTLDEIRRYVYDHAAKTARPDYRFDRDRQHWHLVNAHDSGWRFTGGWRVALDGEDPQLVSPADFWQAADVPAVSITAACQLREPSAQLFWKTLSDHRFTEEKSVRVELTSDGREHTYRVLLCDLPTYRGAITGLRLDPAPNAVRGDYFLIQSLRAAD